MDRAFFLYRRLLWLHARLLVAIGLGVLVFEVFMVWVSAQMGMGQGFEMFLEQVLPARMQPVVFEQFGVTSFEGVVAFGFEHPMFLVAVVGFIIAAATVPAAERESGFLDLVLARPVRRDAYLFATTLLVLTGALALPLAILVGAGVGLATVQDVPAGLTWTSFVSSAVALAVLLLAVGGITLLSAVSARRRGPAIGRVVGLVLVFYWLDLVGPFWELLHTARWISPFAYFDPAGAVKEGLHGLDVAVLFGVFVVTAGAAFLEFGREDL